SVLENCVQALEELARDWLIFRPRKLVPVPLSSSSSFPYARPRAEKALEELAGDWLIFRLRKHVPVPLSSSSSHSSPVRGLKSSQMTLRRRSGTGPLNLCF